MGEKSRQKRLRRVQGDEQHAPLLDSAEARHRVIWANEFKIRALKREFIKASGDNDCIVLMLDLNDGLARTIFEEASKTDMEKRRVGQPMRPDDTLQLLAVEYPLFRKLFSPNHRNVFDACAPSDIRVAFLSEGRTMAVIIPGDVKLADISPVVAVQTEEDRKAGRVIPPGILNDPNRRS